MNNRELRGVLEQRRLKAGTNGKPLSYRKFADFFGIDHAELFRLMKGQNEIGLDYIRRIAIWAVSQDDKELLKALSAYALGVEI